MTESSPQTPLTGNGNPALDHQNPVFSLSNDGSSTATPTPTTATPTTPHANKITTAGPLDGFDLGYFGLDIGGSLSKIVFYEPKDDPRIKTTIEFILKNTHYGSTGERDAALCITTPYGRFHFILFETRRMHSAVEMILRNKVLVDVKDRIRALSATGGGAYKFEEVFKDAIGLGVAIRQKDEIKCLMKGLNFLLTHVPDEAFYYVFHKPTRDDVPETDGGDANGRREVRTVDFTPHVENNDSTSLEGHEELYPYLLVNVGTGVSIIRVERPDKFDRVSGSAVGGGTYWGLVKLLTKVNDFNESMKLSESGNTANVDMTVGDIYGGRDYSALGLNASMTASFFGKFVTKDPPLLDGVSDADICKGLLHLVTNNIGQIAYLNALRFNCKSIFFAGNFLRKNETSMIALAHAIEFWSGGTVRALFLKHEGYFGALGAFLPP
ncbi:hypothetical protein HK102_003926 [Quaeritorhiza haematococci]|nr:hypothetical protein HK102_003926 [Quaeritorhiza haematococci]